MDFQKILLDGAQGDFVLEIIGRTLLMFLMILFVLRLSGRRGVRQLTLFEVAIILAMGSAAGDPMFQEDLPVVYAFTVLLCIVAIYKTTTWFSSKSIIFHRILEGMPLQIVKDGAFNVKHAKDQDFSKMEFFSELRNQSIEHLGQVREAVLETDGSMSVLFYPDDEVKFGLPLFPSDYKPVEQRLSDQILACMFCGFTVKGWNVPKSEQCPRCGHKQWAKALNTRRFT